MATTPPPPPPKREPAPTPVVAPAPTRVAASTPTPGTAPAPGSAVRHAQLPPLNIVREAREMERNSITRSYFEAGFNDYIKDAMAESDRKEYLENNKWIRRGLKYSYLAGFVLAMSPGYIAKRFRLWPFYARWPVRIGLLFAPMIVYWNFPNEKLAHERQVQAKLFDKYTVMDPKELEKKLPEVKKTMMGYQKIFEARLKIPSMGPKKEEAPKK